MGKIQYPNWGISLSLCLPLHLSCSPLSSLSPPSLSSLICHPLNVQSQLLCGRRIHIFTLFRRIGKYFIMVGHRHIALTHWTGGGACKINAIETALSLSMRSIVSYIWIYLNSPNKKKNNQREHEKKKKSSRHIVLERAICIGLLWIWMDVVSACNRQIQHSWTHPENE